MTVEYVLLAVAGVGLVLTLTLPSIRSVLFMMFAVGLTDFFLFGEMFILGIRFNQVSIINMSECGHGTTGAGGVAVTSGFGILVFQFFVG
mgnify:CR=1 FL=1